MKPVNLSLNNLSGERGALVSGIYKHSRGRIVMASPAHSFPIKRPRRGDPSPP